MQTLYIIYCPVYKNIINNILPYIYTNIFEKTIFLTLEFFLKPKNFIYLTVQAIKN